jgi:hypothetical protein
MKNSIEFMRSDAERAFKLVLNAYAAPSGLSNPSESIHKLFHFVEAGRWNYYLKYIARFNVAEDHSANVEGVTHSYGRDTKIGINKSYFTFATLVHESIHFFSHYAFRKAFTVAKYEGATEYLTRNLLDDFSPRKDMHGQGDIYGKEIAPFLSVIVEQEYLPQLCKAYFTGDREIISALKYRLENYV